MLIGTPKNGRITKTRLPLAAEAMVLFFAASQPALATDPTRNWCEGVRIAAFPGGYEPGRGDRYSDAVYYGFRQAALDLGPTVTYYFSHWSPDEMVREFKRTIDEKVDGVVLIPYGFNAAADSLIHKAFAQGTIVISAAVELPDDERAYSSEGMGYVGAPLYDSGVAVASEMVKRAELKAGDTVLVWGQKAEGGETGPYLGGINDTLKKVGVRVAFLAVDPSAYRGDVGPSAEAFSDAMGANPGIKAVFIEQGFLTENFALIARDLKRGQAYMVGSELSGKALTAVKDGYLNLIVDEQPYLNGYLPILNICLTKKFGFSGLHVNRGVIFVDSSNIDAVAPLVEQGLR
jgi:simple sugar transport system substrate-binding protein